MRKTLLKVLGCLTFGAVFAQNDLPRVEIFEPQGGIMDSLWGAWVQGVSHNGEYAVGYGDEYTTWSFIWDRTSGEYRLITGAYKNISCANSVSNNGLVVGSFLTDLRNDSTIGFMVPGIWRDGKWTRLPVWQTDGQLTEGTKAYVNGEACFISGDGKIITSYLKSPSFDRTMDDGTTKKVSLNWPAIWRWDEVWEEYLLDPVPSKKPTGDELQQGVWSAYGSSQDGSVISVVADHPTGSRSPGVMVGGELTRIYGKEDIDIWSDETLYFYDGVAACVSPDGTYVPGYWSESGTAYDLKAFVYNTVTEELEEFDQSWGAATAALDDGTIYGMTGYMGESTIRTADKSYCGLFSEYLKLYYDGYEGNIPANIMSVSGDGKVIGGWYVVADGMGALMVPTIVVLNSEPNKEPNKINENLTDDSRFTVKEGRIQAIGAISIEIYNAQGLLLHAADTSLLPTEGLQGLIFVKAIYPDGTTRTQKLLLE